MEDNTTPTTEQTEKAEKFWASVEERTKTIADALKCKVYPIVIASIEQEGEFVVGFARRPDMVTQLRLIDKSEGNRNGIALEVAAQVMEALLIVSECDKELADKNGENYELYFKAACYTLKQFMGLAIPVIKKK